MVRRRLVRGLHLLAGLRPSLVWLFFLVVLVRFQGLDGILSQGNDGSSSQRARYLVKPGGDLSRDAVQSQAQSRGVWLPRVPAIGNRRLVQDLRQAGKTYQVLLKAAITARRKDPPADPADPRYLLGLFELRARQTIETNDGRQLKTTWEITDARQAKLVVPHAGIEVDLGPPGVPVLGILPFRGEPGCVEAVTGARLANAVLADTNLVSEDRIGRGYIRRDNLTGKRVRLTYIDGVGVTSVEPLGEALQGAEGAAMFFLPVLPECGLLTRTGAGTGQRTWTRMLAWPVCLEPSLCLQLRALLKIAPSRVGVDATDRLQLALDGSPAPGRAASGVSCVSPEGTAVCDRHDHLLQSLEIQGPLSGWDLCPDRLLYETELADAVVQISYACAMEDVPRGTPAVWLASSNRADARRAVHP